MSNLVQGVGKVLATMFIWILVLFVLLPQAKFKIISVLLSNIGIGYYDAVTPLFILVLLAESYIWIVKPRVNGP
jgi:hypothetical protein